jgi:hypothetical protein
MLRDVEQRIPLPPCLFHARRAVTEEMLWVGGCSVRMRLARACKNKTGNGSPNIVDLLQKFLPHGKSAGLFVCPSCGKDTGFIEKNFKTQDKREWAPFLRGAIYLEDDRTSSYQPFVFLVSYEPAGAVVDCWFSYYRDFREDGGRLKLGYGPGGPPVLGHSQIVDLVDQLRQLGYLKAAEIT